MQTELNFEPEKKPYKVNTFPITGFRSDSKYHSGNAQRNVKLSGKMSAIIRNFNF